MMSSPNHIILPENFDYNKNSSKILCERLLSLILNLHDNEGFALINYIREIPIF